MTGLALVVGTLAVAVLVGLGWRRRQGHLPARTATVLPELVRRRIDSAAAVTLLQLSTPICARCPQVRALLAELSAVTPGVGYAEIDLAEHPELAGELAVRSTPTTLVISRTGHELFRVRGVPARTELLSALQPHL